jgi:magnesium chelatase subunit D
MNPEDRDATGGWHDASLAAALLALAPAYLGGLQLRALPGPVRETWLEELRRLLPHGAPVRRVPLHANTASLLGGLDLAATLQAGRPVAQRGLMVECHGGVALLAMAERVERGTVAQLAGAMDFAEVILERDGLAARHAAEFGVVALDESVGPDECLSPVLADRLAFRVDLHPIGIHDVDEIGLSAADLAMAREGLPQVMHEASDTEQLCAVALSLGVDSMRASLLALRAARAAAALRGADRVQTEDLAVAARLVLAPRATLMPAVEEDSEPDDRPPPPSNDEADRETNESADPETAQKLEDRVLEAALAAIPEQLMASLQAGRAPRRGAQTTGKSGAVQRSKLRGRPLGARRGDPRSGARLSLIDTLRAAAPWQGIRRRRRPEVKAATKVLVERDDFHVVRFKQRAETTTIFVVDASGSAALHRLAEAKGAVELLLADCYVRRDQVALIAFRGESAELLLPPTRSLVRAKRSLAALPGGGGTPLAAGLDAAAALCDLVQRRGGTPTVVCLTDGRANVGRQGAKGREQALTDALESATTLRLTGVRSMVIDTSPRPHASAARIAEAMQGMYLPLPHADAAKLSGAVQQAAGTPGAL